MKKILALCLCLLLLLSACGTKAPDPTIPETTEDNSNDSQQLIDDDADATADDSASNDTTGNGDASADDAKALAESCIDKSVTELFDLIGETESSDYAPSCNGGEGAEDGNLYYDGFIVYTLKEGDNETVVFVE